MTLTKKTKESINVPYVKNYENGIITNPITTFFKSGASDRGERRNAKLGRDFNNRNTSKLSIVRSGREFIKIKKRIQVIAPNVIYTNGIGARLVKGKQIVHFY